MSMAYCEECDRTVDTDYIDFDFLLMQCESHGEDLIDYDSKTRFAESILETPEEWARYAKECAEVDEE